MQSAQRVFLVLLVGLSVMFLVRSLRTEQGRHPRTLLAPYKGFLETFARMTSELTLLLATLGLVTASFTITGVPTKVGFLILEVASIHIALMVLVAFAFGYVVGMGLPPAPTYIIVAVVIAPFMVNAGIDPWVVHFYAFLIAAFGELSPPTSLTAAVTSRIAEASFTRTMFRALEMCLPLLVLMIAVFTWPGLVSEPGVAQLVPFTLVLIATLGLIASLHGRFSEVAARQRVAKAGLAALSAALILHPPLPVAVVLALAVGALTTHSFLRTRKLTKPSGQAAESL